MATIEIPRFFPCRLQADSLDYGANFACIDLPIDGRRKALLMFSTRELAERFIAETGKSLNGWIAAYMGYDVMAPWLARAAQVSEADSIVVDIRALGLHQAHVADVETVLTTLNTGDTESGDPLSVEVEAYSL